MECPYCKEEIQDGALKCKHCDSMLGSPIKAEETTSAFSYYVKCFQQYATFRGRARRKEFWFFVLFHLLISMALGLVDGILGTFSPEAGMGLLGGIYSLGVLIPALAVSVRRLHDTNRSGWWLLISLIPIVGTIMLIIFFAQESKPDNKHGNNPKLAFA